MSPSHAVMEVNLQTGETGRSRYSVFPSCGTDPNWKGSKVKDMRKFVRKGGIGNRDVSEIWW